MSTPITPITPKAGTNTNMVLEILQIVLSLEPAALALVLSLVNGLNGKADAAVLAEDSSTWATILANAKAAQAVKV